MPTTTPRGSSSVATTLLPTVPAPSLPDAPDAPPVGASVGFNPFSTWPTAPAAYALVASADGAVVDLSGGASTLRPVFTGDVGPTRELTGRVVDGNGAPIAGAIVLISAKLSLWRGALMAQHGVTTGADGTFKTPAPAAAGAAIAITPAAWSAITPLAPGAAGLQLVIAAPTALEVTIPPRDGGAVIIVELIHDATKTVLSTTVPPDGRAVLRPMPPGAYKLSVAASHLMAGGAGLGAFLQQDIALEAGTTLRRTVEVPVGGLITVTALTAPAGELAYRLAAGQLAPSSADDVAAQLGKPMCTGAASPESLCSFPDRAAGTYTACVVVTPATGQPLFGCRVFAHDGHDADVDVAIASE